MNAQEILAAHNIDLPSADVGHHYALCPQCSAERRTRAHQMDPCLGVKVDDRGVTWGCNHCGWTGGEAFHKANGHANGHERASPFEAVYDYVDEAGKLLFQVCRKPNKGGFPQRAADGSWKTADVRKVLYRLPEVLEAIASGRVIALVEGEKDANALWSIGIPATCSPGGAAKPGQAPKWRREYSELLRGADLVVLNDNDDAGRAHAEATASMSAGIAKSVRRLDLAKHWPEMPDKADVLDWLTTGHTREELDGLMDFAPDYQRSDAPHPTASEPQTDRHGNPLSSEALMVMAFNPIKYVVPGVIVEGLTLLAGKPKTGKSWLMLHAAIAVARGGFTLGETHCVEGDVLYCALEDNLRRLQSRMSKLLQQQPAPKRLFFLCELPRLAEGGLAQIKQWIEGANHPRLVIIDTLAMVRMPNRKDQSTYDADYTAVKELRALANAHGIAIVLVHHLRKEGSDDAFDTVSGTLGLTGAPDSILVLKRDTGGFVLHGRGRDLIEFEKAAIFNADACTWTITGDAGAMRVTAQRNQIIAALGEATEPMGPNDIAASTGMKPPNVRFLLGKLVRDGAIQKAGRGQYLPIGRTPQGEEGERECDR